VYRIRILVAVQEKPPLYVPHAGVVLLNRFSSRGPLKHSVKHRSVVEPATAIPVVATENQYLYAAGLAYRARTRLPWAIVKRSPDFIAGALSASRDERVVFDQQIQQPLRGPSCRCGVLPHSSQTVRLELG
jgi:hypothetical protein